MPTVNYRPVTEADLPAVVEMYVQLNEYFYKMGYRLPHPENVGELWLESFKRTLGRFSNIFVAELFPTAELSPPTQYSASATDDETGKQLAGFMLCRVKRIPQYMGGVLVGELSDMWIIESARRMGIGDRLSRLALDWLREQGVHSVEIQVLRDNEASWKLYEKMGFQLEFRVGRLLWDEYCEK